ncbi:hypothetical protein [Parapedobacter sp. 2B3]
MKRPSHPCELTVGSSDIARNRYLCDAIWQDVPYVMLSDGSRYLSG